VNGFLKFKADVWGIPDCRSTRFSALTNENITVLDSEFFFFVFFERHLLKVRKVDVEPAHIRIPKIWNQASAVLLRVEHLAQACIRDIGKPHSFPILRNPHPGSSAR
jgi:hypothetical protein